MTTTEVPLVQVQQLTQAEYRADLRLATHSRVRKMLPPSTPAHARWELDNETWSDNLDLGKAAHREVLGAGDDYQVVTGSGVDPNAWATKDTKTEVEQVRAAGKTPIRPKDHATIVDMAKALRRNRLAAALLNPENGAPEQAILWPDEHIPAVRRGTLLDWLPNRPTQVGKRLLLSDYKTADEADPEEWARGSAHKYGYHSQAAWNLDAAHALYPELGEDDVAFMFIVQSKKPPYPVAVVQLEDEDVRIGRALNTWAIQRWHQCWESGVWQGYGDQVHTVSLPAWYRDRWRPIA